MKTVILCGGMGTRLREETDYRPKPMVEVGGRPILWHIMKIYAHYGFREFVLCLGYRGAVIRDYFLNYEEMNNDFTISLGRKRQIVHHDAHSEQDYEVTLAETGPQAMTGARIKRVQHYVDGDTFMVTYGDGVADVDLSKVLAFHRAHGKLATMTTIAPSSRFGMLEVDGANRVTSFIEKPQLTGQRANAGFFVFQRRVFDYLSSEDSCILEHEPLEKLARDGEIMAYLHDGFFYAMDTYREYQKLNELWASGKPPWKVWR
jgi:glucose-1-phosphate cytidylyltransferase